jgi:hypothetical protein
MVELSTAKGLHAGPNHVLVRSACTMYLGYATEEGGEATTKTAIANTILLAPSRPYGSETTSNQGSLWEERIELSQPFYELLQKHPVPVYEPAIQRLQNNSAALDVYVWLCYRLHVLQATDPNQLGAAQRAIRAAVRHDLPVPAQIQRYPSAGARGLSGCSDQGNQGRDHAVSLGAGSSPSGT